MLPNFPALQQLQAATARQQAGPLALSDANQVLLTSLDLHLERVRLEEEGRGAVQG